MIQHVVLLKWRRELEADELQMLSQQFAALAEHIDEIRDYRFGADLGIYRGNADYALIAMFDNEEDLRSYVTHPLHQAFLTDIAGPLLDSFMSAQFILPPA